jgi:hypothetical protein
MNMDPYRLTGNFGDSVIESTIDAATRIINQPRNKFTAIYFSKDNIERIQRQLIRETKRLTKGIDIGKQSEGQLLMIMCGLYKLYGTFDGKNVEAALGPLNKLVVAECVKQILPNIEAYLLYIRDASQPFGGGGERAFARPTDVSVKGTKTTTGFLPLQR